MTKIYLSLTRSLTVLLMLATFVAFGQTRTVTGKVTSPDDGAALPGVNILEKGTSNGTVSDTNGAYTINVTTSDPTLVFSFIGYKSTEVAVGDRSTLDLALDSDVTALNEVVVVGYGEVNRRDATGAIATIKSSDFNRGIISSPEQLIQGKTAGVQITSSSGEPGAGVNLRIRGTSSVRGGNSPLYVVDGIPLSNDDVSAGGSDFGRGTSSAKNPLNFINPNDIESIDILKDASATAIYGSRGANGVVIITTKSGKGKKQTLEYSTNVSISKQAKYYDVLDGPSFIAAYGALGGDANGINYGANTNWQKEISRTAVSQSHNLSYGNGYKTGNYRASLAYDDQEGIIKNSSMKRYTGRLNLNQSFLKDKLKFAAQTLFSKVNDQAAPISNTPGFEGDLIGSSIYYNPTIPAVASNTIPGTNTLFSSDAANPLSMLKYYKDVTATDRQLINLSLGYDITKELNFKVNTGFDRSHSLRTSAMSALQSKVNNVNGNGKAFLNDQKNANNLVEAYLTYQKKIGDNQLTVLAGYSYQSFDIKGRNASAVNFGDQTNMDWMIQDLKDADNAINGYITEPYQTYEYQKDSVLRVYHLFPTGGYTEQQVKAGGLPTINPRGLTANNYSSKDALQSYFARGNYNIGEKYFLTASVRADGSTRFGSNNKYGIFPSAAAKWRLSEEDFVPEVFDNLAVRLGYGITGNQSIPHNLYSGRGRYGSITNLQYAPIGLSNNGVIGGAAGIVDVSFSNPNLQWEQTSQINFGIDFGFFNSRLSGTIDIYSKNTTKLLIQTPSAEPAPSLFVWQNLDANVMNNGAELTLNYIVAERKNFGLTVGFNIAYNKNMVKNYAGAPLPTGAINGQGLTGAYAQRIANNQPLFAYYLRDFKGYNADGLNADTDIQQFIGKSALPKVNTGFSLNVRAYNFDLAAYMYGQFGQYIYNNTGNAFFTKGAIGAGHNVISSAVNSTESKANSPDVSTRFLEKGDFLRMQNLSLGYSAKLNDKNLIKKVRLSVTAQNLFVITKYTGRDPEVNVDKNISGVPSSGIDYTSYPRARTVSFGLNATF